ncbi:GIY-YIG nuclease family protein [Pyruvatibacter sp.]|uniref:GIY-YIG nuclease family protein n=1 Tax=Pyruvatibacter sp. TaxID=1981328 RepID=UPI0032EAFF6B
MAFFVYIMTNRKHGTLYIGQTDDLPKRAHQHRNGLVDGFTKEYGLKRLVYFEATEDRDSARYREHQLKNWQRAWKIELIEKINPDWQDLFDELV